MTWRLAADAVLVLHLSFVVFVVLGGVLTWRWPRLALVHLPVAVYGVVIQLVGFRCPLTPLEKALRRRAGDEGYDEGFVEHYIVPVLYPGEFTAGVKLVLALLVLGVNVAVYVVAWRIMWPRRRAKRSAGTTVTA
ncbi:MAG: DUF2784 domain-containing protein [Acidimicrobiia bacterium]|nr:DUF2784 domain-containing protein [Acidimicrobiia bacterium]